MLYAAAREKAVPSIFAKVNEKSGVPINAVLFTGIIALGATLMSTLGYTEAISISVSAAVFANWLMMAIMNIALVVVRVTRPELRPVFRFPVNIRNIPILAIFAAIACLWILTHIKPLPLMIGFSWLILLSVWYFLYSKKRWEYLGEEEMEQLAQQSEELT